MELSKVSKHFENTKKVKIQYSRLAELENLFAIATSLQDTFQHCWRLIALRRLFRHLRQNVSLRYLNTRRFFFFFEKRKLLSIGKSCQHLFIGLKSRNWEHPKFAKDDQGCWKTSDGYMGLFGFGVNEPFWRFAEVRLLLSSLYLKPSSGKFVRQHYASCKAKDRF